VLSKTRANSNRSDIGNMGCRFFGTVTRTSEFGAGTLGQRMQSPNSTALALRLADVTVLSSNRVAGGFRLDDCRVLALPLLHGR
jgi:hypothetical protein